MKSGIRRRRTTTMRVTARRLGATSAALGVALGLSVGLAPAAPAADGVQSQQWYLDGMRASEMWKVTTGKGVKVAVVDSGVNPNTPSLKGQVLTDEVKGAVGYHATKDYVGHGTTLAEMIAGTGAGGGIKGIAPGAKIVPYRISLAKLKDKAERAKTPEPAAAVRAAADTDVKIINMSFGDDYVDPDLEEAIKYAQSKGKLMFASVGNDAKKKNYIGYPAAYDGVVGVAALDKAGNVGKFSEHGSYVDLAAPGLNLPYWCDTSFTSYCSHAEGTSFSAAYASASAALIWSAHPDWSANQVLRVLIDTAGRKWPKDRPSVYLGYGVVRAGQSILDGKGKPGAADIDPISGKKTTAESGSNSESSPSSSKSGSSQPSEKASDVPAEEAGSESESSSGNSTLWIALGAVAAVIVIGGGGFAIARARRNQ